MKQCTDLAMHFYQIRWFDITAFAFKAPKVQEVVVEITASDTAPFVCKYDKLCTQQMSERSRLYSGRDGPECETMYQCIFQNQGIPSRLGAALSCLAWPRLALPCYVLSYRRVVMLCIFNFSINRVFTADNNIGKI